MKKKIILLVVLIILITLGFFCWNYISSKNFTIPQDYKLKLENKMSHIDGSDITYYIYDNKIIMESIDYYPIGHLYTKKCTIILYNNINTSNVDSVSDITKLIENVNGKKVYQKAL